MTPPGRTRNVAVALWLVAAALLAGATACSSTPSLGSRDGSAGPTASPSAPAASASPSPSASWQSYRDQRYGFSISYPADFTFMPSGSPPPSSGWLASYRAVDNRFLSGYPPGQVEMHVYVKDADTLTSWVQKHSDSTCGLPGGTGFFWNVTNLRPVTAAGRLAVAFEDDPKGCTASLTIHQTAFFLGSDHVFTFDWWSTDTSYGPTVQAIAERMLASFSG